MKLFSFKLIRYVFVQTFTYFIDMGAFLCILHIGLIGPLGANIVSRIIAGCVAFILHRHFTFNIAKSGFAKRQAIRYFLVLFANVPIASVLLWLILLWAHSPAMAKILADIICLMLSYLLSKHFIFTVKKPLLNNT